MDELIECIEIESNGLAWEFFDVILGGWIDDFMDRLRYSLGILIFLMILPLNNIKQKNANLKSINITSKFPLTLF